MRQNEYPDLAELSFCDGLEQGQTHRIFNKIPSIPDKDVSTPGLRTDKPGLPLPDEDCNILGALAVLP